MPTLAILPSSLIASIVGSIRSVLTLTFKVLFKSFKLSVMRDTALRSAALPLPPVKRPLLSRLPRPCALLLSVFSALSPLPTNRPFASRCRLMRAVSGAPCPALLPLLGDWLLLPAPC